MLPQKTQRECRNATGWRGDDHCQWLLLPGGSSAGVSLGYKVLQIPGDVIYIKEQSLHITKVPAWNPGQRMCILVFYFIHKLLFFPIVSEWFKDELCPFRGFFLFLVSDLASSQGLCSQPSAISTRLFYIFFSPTLLSVLPPCDNKKPEMCHSGNSGCLPDPEVWSAL